MQQQDDDLGDESGQEGRELGAEGLGNALRRVKQGASSSSSRALAAMALIMTSAIAPGRPAEGSGEHHEAEDDQADDNGVCGHDVTSLMMTHEIMAEVRRR